MKKIYITVFTLFVGMVSAQAQTNRGTWHIGSSLGTSSALSEASFALSPYNSYLQGGVSNITMQSKPDGGTKETTKYRNLGVAGNLGYFLADGIMVGLELGASSVVADLGEDDKLKVSTISASPKVRYFFNNTAKVRPFAEASAGLFRGKIDFGDIDPDFGEITSNGTIWGLRGGTGIFLRENIALDVMISYSGAKFKDSDAGHTLGLGGGFSIFF